MLCLRNKKLNSFTTTRGNSFHCFVKKATVQIVCQLHMPVNLVLGIMNVADHHHHHSNSRNLCLIYLLQFKRIDHILLSKQCDRITLCSIFFFFFSLLPLLLNILTFKLAVMSYQVQQYHIGCVCLVSIVYNPSLQLRRLGPFVVVL